MAAKRRARPKAKPRDPVAPPPPPAFVAPPQPLPRRRAVSPEMALSALHLLVALVVLCALFTAAYQSLDRREPDEETARNLHIAVLVVGLVLLGAAVWLSQRISPWTAVGALVGLPVGFVLLEMATDYTQTECWSGFWWTSCRSEGGAPSAMNALLIVFGLSALLAATICRLGLGPRSAAAVLLGAGMAVAVAFLVASGNLLPHLHDEAVKAAEANKPIVHDTPGLAIASVVAGLLAAAGAARRRT